MAILAQRNPVFQRSMRIIQSISNAYPAVVTTTFNHNYLTGMIVRLNVPLGYGMVQANQLYGPIVVTGNNTFTIDIDTLMMDPFISLVGIGSTDSSGNATGVVSGNILPFLIGQSFSIGSQVYTIVSVGSASLSTGSTGSGTFNSTTGSYSFSGALVSTQIFLNQVPCPESYQFAQVTPIGEQSDMLAAATQNVLPYSAT